MIGVLALYSSAIVSAAVCGTCHRSEARSQPATSMGHALELVADCGILRAHPLLTFCHGRYSYAIRREGSRSIYSVTDGAATLSVPIRWAFGMGTAGQTYVLQIDGALYESRVSFYNAIDGLDQTIGSRGYTPKNLTDAAGRRMTQSDVVDCFGCHSTGGVHGFTVDFDQMRPGVECENCHPHATGHVKALQAGDAKDAAMPSLVRMTAEESAEFCGRCHRTWAQIAANGPYGIPNVRFQPYRLTNSKCYDPVDRRISCIACHNPHAEIVRNTAVYDSKCLACHDGTAKAPGKVCRVGKRDCAGCHMPKVDLPGAHHQFTDHQIRIVRANQRYPN